MIGKYVKRYLCIGLSGLLVTASPIAVLASEVEPEYNQGVESYTDTQSQPTVPQVEETDQKPDYVEQATPPSVPDVVEEYNGRGEEYKRTTEQTSHQQENYEQSITEDQNLTDANMIIVMDGASEDYDQSYELQFTSDNVTVFASRADGLPFEAGTTLYVAPLDELLREYTAEDRQLVQDLVTMAVFDELFQFCHICESKDQLTYDEKNYLYRKYNGMFVDGKQYLPIITGPNNTFVTDLDIVWTYIFKDQDRVNHLIEGTQGIDVFFMNEFNATTLSEFKGYDARIIDQTKFNGVSFEPNNANYTINFVAKEDLAMFYTSDLTFIPNNVQEANSSLIANNPGDSTIDIDDNNGEQYPEQVQTQPEEQVNQDVAPETETTVTQPDNTTENQNTDIDIPVNTNEEVASVETSASDNGTNENSTNGQPTTITTDTSTNKTTETTTPETTTEETSADPVTTASDSPSTTIGRNTRTGTTTPSAVEPSSSASSTDNQDPSSSSNSTAKKNSGLTASGLSGTSGKSTASGLKASGITSGAATGSGSGAAAATSNMPTLNSSPVASPSVQMPNIIKTYYPCPWELTLDYDSFKEFKEGVKEVEKETREWISDYDKTNEVPLWLEAVAAFISPV